MTAEDRVQAALREAEPVPALRLLVEDLARAGNSKTAIYGLLENALVQLRRAPHFRDGDEDAVLDVMDALGGWCHPGAALLPDQPGS